MSCESYDLRLTTLSPIHIGSGKSYSCCEFVPAKAKSKGQIVKIIKRVNLTNYYSSLSDDRKDTFLASLTNSNFELKQFDKKIKKDFVRYQCIDNSRVDFINEVQEHIKTSDKLYIPGSSIKGAIRTAIFYDLLTEEDMDKIGRDISSNRRNNSFLSNDLLKKHFTSGFGNDAQYNIFRFMQVADTTTTNLPRIEQVLAVMATDDRRKNQFYSRHGKVVKSYLETIGANKNLTICIDVNFKNNLLNFNQYSEQELVSSELGLIPKEWEVSNLTNIANYQNGLAMQKFPPENDADCFKVLKIKELRQGFFDETSDSCSKNIKEECIVYDGDVIFSWSGSLLVDIWTGGTCGLNQHLFKVTSSKFDKWFYYCWTKFYLDQFILIAKDKATTMGHIKRKHLDESLVLIPDKETYSKLTMLFKPLFDMLIKNKIEIKKLQNLRDVLMPKLMSGEVDVSKINCDLELKYNYMKYLFNQIHKQLSKSVV